MRLAASQLTLPSGEALVLRSPEPTEAEAVLTYVRTVMRDAWRNMNHPADGFDRLSVEQEAAIVGGFAAHPRNFMLAAFAGDRIVGMLSLTTGEPLLVRHNGTLGMSVDAACRGQGVGRALLARCVEETEAAGVWVLHLRVRTFNVGAIALYEQLGFERVGTLRSVAKLDDGYADEYMYERLGRRPGD